MDLARYPADWRQISLRIRFERADGRCEWCGAENLQPHPETGSKVILTVAHLGAARPDGTPGDKHDKMDVRDENLAALCQRCHLNYDRDEHQVNAAATRRRRRLQAGQIELPLTDRKDIAMGKKEHEARELINSILGNDLADIWPAEDVFEYLEADGFEWNGGEWVVTSRPARNGFDDVDLVPSLV